MLTGKLSIAEQDYVDSREELIKSVDLVRYIDAPFVFASRQVVSEMLVRTKLFEMTKDVQGSVIECGVYMGNSLMLYNHLSSILEPYSFRRKVFGFDTFSGFPDVSENDDNSIEPGMFSDTSYHTLSSMISISDKNRPMSHVNKCELIKGPACETIPAFVKEHEELLISLLYLDFDLYEPTKIALQNFLPLVPKGGVVAFDELNAKRWKGETIALKECIDLRSIRLRRFDFDFGPSYFIVGE